MEYKFNEIEKKWQNYWDENKTFFTDVWDFSKPKFYALDMFPYRTPTSPFSEFASISVPMLVIFGNNGEFLLQDSKLVFDLLNQKKHPHAKLSCQVIDGAPHSYTSKENDLAHVIINWVEDKI